MTLSTGTPSSRKRQADDEFASQSDDAVTPGAPPTTASAPKSKRMTKEEKAAARARAAAALGIAVDPTPTKRRKLNSVGSPPPKKSTEKPAPVSAPTPATAPSPAKSAKKPTKKQEARQRAAAWAAEQNKKAANAAPASAPVPVPRPVQVSAPTPAAAPSPAKSAKKPTKMQVEARQRAAAWDAEQNKQAATAPAPIAFQSAAKPPKKSTTTDSRGINIGSTRGRTFASLLGASRRTAYTGRSSLGGVNVKKNTLPNPRSSFTASTPPSTIPSPPVAQETRKSPNAPIAFTIPTPTRTIPAPPAVHATASGQETNETTGSAFSFSPVLQQPPSGFSSPTPVEIEPSRIPPKMDTGVVAPRRYFTIPPTVNRPPTALNGLNFDPLMSTKERIDNFLVGKLFLFAILPLAVLSFHLYATGSFVYNPISGMFMVVGSARTPYIPKAQRPIMPQKPKPEVLCYQDSPAHVFLEWGNDLTDVTPHVDCTKFELPCPHHAICFQGNFVACQEPVWEMNGDHCVLSKSVNDTYQGIVSLIETWTIDQLCFTRREGITPLSVYAQNATDPTQLVVSDADTAGRLSINAIPLYTWATVFKEGPENLENWDWELLQLANQPRQLLALDKSSVASVGLAKNHFALVVRTKLPLACKISRTFITVVEGIGFLIEGIFKAFFRLILALLDVFWFVFRFCFGMYPKLTVGVTVGGSIVGGFVLWYQHRKISQQRRKKRVREIRQVALQRLQMAHQQNPGPGMRQGEVAVLHLRDSLFDYFYGRDEGARSEFFCLWSEVAQQVNYDNRVGKEERMVGGTVRKLWTWVAVQEDIMYDS